ncbi:unnamed protein product [Lactuca saligna]|uniref:Uncharacterized protein n=1 Tax=Lactuca saligna TaxID=75948 RepID=A0AA35VF67_LACSI|nr:unnamed protein product [Lactuca saligna]
MAQLGPFLTRVLWDDSSLKLFVCHRRQQVVGFREVIYKKIYWEFFSTVHFDKASMRWADILVFTFRLGGIFHSYNLIELRRRLGIYTVGESGVTLWDPRKAKESTFTSPIYRLIHQLVASTICHREECDKVPSVDLSYIWCLTQIEVFLHRPFDVALYLFGVALSSIHLSRICGDHWVTCLALSYEVDTSEMVPIPIRYIASKSCTRGASLDHDFDCQGDATSRAGLSTFSLGRDTDDSEESMEENEDQYESRK